MSTPSPRAPQQQKLINHHRQHLQFWARQVLFEARECSALHARTQGDHHSMLLESAAQAQEMALRYSAAICQETIGHEYAAEQWDELLHQYRRRFVLEVLALAADIINRKR